MFLHREMHGSYAGGDVLLHSELLYRGTPMIPRTVLGAPNNRAFE